MRSHTPTSSTPKSSPTPSQLGLLQHKCDCGNSANLTGKCSKCESDRLTLQRKATNDNEPSEVPPIVHEVLNSYRLKKPAIQTKLKINEPGDRYEQEADRIADQVMRMPEPSIQRQMKLKENEEEGMVQRRAIANQATTSASTQEFFEAPPIVHEVLNSPGQPLDPETRSFMKSCFGHDFSQVQIHTDARAAESAGVVGASAYTMGQSVVFGRGQYSPNTKTGQKLLAHELVHTLQQRQSVSTGVMSASLSIQRTCGPAEIGSVGGCVAREGDISQLGFSSYRQLYQFHPGCDDFKPGEEDLLRQFAATIIPNEAVETVKVEIDGFASEEGSSYFNENLSCARARQAALILSNAGIASDRIQLYKHGATSGSREERRGVVISVDFFSKPRAIQSDEYTLLGRLDFLGLVASKEGTDGAEFKKVVDEFRSTLKQRLEGLNAGNPLPTDLQLIMKALLLWSRDPGNQWGEGIWESSDLVMSAPEYVIIPAGQNKCNAYVAEVVYKSFGVVQKIYEQQENIYEKGRLLHITKTGKYFPYQAKDWGNASLQIPYFPVVEEPKMGDIWSNGSHTGIYLGTYAGKRLSISARDDGDGVFGLKAEVQKEHGIQIKYLPEGGIYRRYTP